MRQLDQICGTDLSSIAAAASLHPLISTHFYPTRTQVSSVSPKRSNPSTSSQFSIHNTMASSKAKKITTTASDVLLFVPNLIGYARVISTLTSLILMVAIPRYWLIATALYLASFVGDLFGESTEEIKRISFEYFRVC